MSLSEFLNNAEKGLHPTCIQCGWNPKKYQKKIAFGKSCLKHGVNWQLDNLANSMQIVQDPGGTTAEKTGKLCFICNSLNSTDRTAQNNYTLWKAAVVLNNSNNYIDKHYWTNSIMHGAGDKSLSVQARKKCTELIKGQIEILKPKIIICSGQYATDSLFELGFISKTWAEMRINFNKGAYIEGPKKIMNLNERWVACTYHTSAGLVNRTVSKLYDDKIFSKCLSEKIKNLNNLNSINEFLKKYNNLETAHKGLRVLLLHWLDIGFIIRKNYESI